MQQTTGLSNIAHIPPQTGSEVAAAPVKASPQPAHSAPRERKSGRQDPLLLSYCLGPLPWMMESIVVLSTVGSDWAKLGVILGLLIVNLLVSPWQDRKAAKRADTLDAKLTLLAQKLPDTTTVSPAAHWAPRREVVRVRLGDIEPSTVHMLEGDPTGKLES